MQPACKYLAAAAAAQMIQPGHPHAQTPQASCHVSKGQYSLAMQSAQTLCCIIAQGRGSHICPKK